MLRPLGRRQLLALKHMIRDGYWHPGCGWYMTSIEQILASLAARGLVTAAPWNTSLGRKTFIYYITAAGREAAKIHKGKF